MVGLKELRVLSKNYANYQAQDRMEQYSLIGQQPENIHLNCYRGKFGECIVYTTLIMSGKPCTMPNFIKGDHKGYKYDADLMSGANRIHVKTVQTWSINKYGEYFLINKNETLINNWTDFDWFAVVLLDDIDTNYEVAKLIKWVKVGNVINKSEPLENKPFKLRVPYNI